MIFKKSLHQKASNPKFVWAKDRHKIHEAKTDRINEETDKSKILFGDFNTLLSTNGRTGRQKITSHLEEFNTIHQNAVSDISRTLVNNSRAYILYKQGIFSKIDCILVHEININKFKRIKITQNAFSDYN